MNTKKSKEDKGKIFEMLNSLNTTPMKAHGGVDV
jgi:hypothetical protein